MDSLAAELPPKDDPNWIVEALRIFFGEILLYLKTLVGISLRPRRFASDWIQGAGRAMQPLGFLATTVVVHSLWQKLLLWIVYGDPEDNSPLWLDCLRMLGPYVYYALIGVVTHGALRLLGPLRRLRSSVALALYAGAGPASLATLLSTCYFVALRVHSGVKFGEPLPMLHPAFRLLTVLLLVLTFAAFVVPFGLSLHAVHRLPRRRLVLGMLAAMLLAGVLSGFVRFGLGFQANLGSFMPELLLWARRTEAGTLLPYFTLWF